MKRNSKMTCMLAAATVCAALAWNAPAQDRPAAPSLPKGVAQVLQLEQAKMSDDTIIAFIRNSKTTYNLNADQLVYLRQQGMSDGVLTAMLAQAKPGKAKAAAAITVPVQATTATTAVTAPAAPVQVVTPPVTYVQPAPYYYACPAYGYYGWPRPLVSVGWGWRGHWRVGVAF